MVGAGNDYFAFGEAIERSGEAGGFVSVAAKAVAPGEEGLKDETHEVVAGDLVGGKESLALLLHRLLGVDGDSGVLEESEELMVRKGSEQLLCQVLLHRQFLQHLRSDPWYVNSVELCLWTARRVF